MNQEKHPAYAEAMARELSTARVDLERARAELMRRPNPKNRRRLGDSVRMLVDALSRYGQLREAVNAQTDWIAELSDQVQRLRSAENLLRLAKGYERRREIFRQLDRMSDCRADQQQAAALYAAAAEEFGEQDDRCRLGHAKMVLGILSEPEERKALTDEGFTLCVNAEEESDSPENRALLSQACSLLSAADPDRAEEARAVQKRLCGASAEADAETLLNEYGSRGSVGDDQLLQLLQELRRRKQRAEEAGTCAALAQLLAAAAVNAVGEKDRLVQTLAAQASEIWKELEDKTGKARCRLDRARLYLALGRRYAHADPSLEPDAPLTAPLREHEQELPTPKEQALAGSYLDKAWPLLQELEAAGQLDVRNEYASCGEALGSLALLAEEPVKAVSFYETVLEVRRELTQTADFPGCRRALAMDLRCLAIAREEAELPEEALAFYEQELEIRTVLCADTDREADRQQLMFVYDAISGIYKALGDFRQARNYILKKSQIGS